MKRMKILIFHSPYFFISVIIAALFLLSKYPSVVYVSYKEGYSGKVFNLLSFLRFFSMNNADVTLPAVFGIPCLCWMYGEISEKRYYNTIIREKSKDRYAWHILLYSMISGIWLTMLSLLLSFLLSAGYTCFLLEGNMTFGYIEEIEINFLASFYGNLVRDGLGWLAVLIYCMAFFCYASLWPIISVVVLLWVRNRYIAATAPFMLNLILDFYFRIQVLRPTNMLRMAYIDETAYGGTLCILAIFLGYGFFGFLLIRGGVERLCRQSR